MALTPKELLNQLLQTEGAMCAALVDSTSGMVLESAAPAWTSSWPLRATRRSCAPR